MEIVASTRNEGKLREIRELLKGFDVTILSMRDISDAPVVRETGSNFRENALLKAETIAAFTGKLTIADDSGLEVDALGGEPGVYSARFAGEEASDDDNNKELLSRLTGVPMEERGAVFKCVIAAVDPDGKRMFVEGECRGVIQFEERGESGFGYDPLFLVPELGKTFAELTPEIKNTISHRARAMKKLRASLEEHIKASGQHCESV